MSKAYQIAAVVMLSASSAMAQNYYAGGTISAGHISFDGGPGFEGNYQAISVLGGVRFPIGGGNGSGFYAGGEVEASYGMGYDVLNGYEPLDNNQFTVQAEAHLGYAINKIAVYGFYGIGRNPMSREYDNGESLLSIYGVGTEIDLTERLALRAELEMSSMTVDACSTYDPVNLSRVSVGCILKF